MEYGLVVTWWLAYLALAVAGLPIATLAFRALPDRGAALALPTTFLVLFVSVYWLGHLAFSPLTIGLCVLLLAALSLGLAWRGVDVEAGRFVEWGAVFTLAFGLLVAVRSVDPSIVPIGGEKFLDFGLLKSLLRADRLPPIDMWFAGERVQYYYGGHLLAAVLTTLTGTAARYAYNLALAGFYGALVASAYGLAGSIGAARGVSYRRAGILGGLLVGFASNLAPALGALLYLLPEGIAGPIATAVSESTQLGRRWLLTGESPAGYYWAPSRIIEGTINEFPLFAFLNGDLHAHMMSTVFLVLAAGLAFAYYRTPGADLRRRRALLLGALPPVAGTLAVVNTWSFPSVAGVAGVALLFAPTDPRDLLPATVDDRLRSTDSRLDEAGRVASAIVGATAVGVLGVVWALPFFVGPATGASGRSIGLVGDQSDLIEFALVHGWVLLSFGVYLGARGLDRLSRPGLVASVAAVVFLLATLVGAGGLGLLVPLFALAWYGLRRDWDLGFESVLFVAGAGLVVLVEFVFLQEQAGPGRLNTVFKTYMQVWVLWAIATAGALARLTTGLLPVDADLELPLSGALFGRAFAIGLVISLSIYGGVALGAHFEDAGPATLDATSYAQTRHPYSWDAISYLDNYSAQPTIVTAPGCWCNPGTRVDPYRWVNAPSSFTGLPTVAGWSHETGYRGREVYRARVADVRTIFTGDWADRVELLKQYDVRFVYLGPNERTLYGGSASPLPANETAWAFEEHRDDPGVTLVYRNDRVSIYAIDPGKLG